MGFWGIVKKAKELWSWYSFAVGVSALAITGVGLAIGGAVWLVNAGIPIPLALMAGYCTLVGAVYLGMAPFAFRAMQRANKVETAPPAAPKKERNRTPNWTAWRHIEKFTLRDAACLWCEIDPTLGNSEEPETRSWIEALKAGVRQRQFEIVFEDGLHRDMKDYYRANPDSSTEVTKEELKKFARLHDYHPRFLRLDPANV